MTLKDILKSKPSAVITIHQDRPISEAVKIMADKNISALMVVDADNKLKGMFTERDVVRCVARNIPFDKEPIVNLMTHDVIKFESSTEISAVISVVVNKKKRHIPVVEGDKIVGMVTYRDLVSYLLPEVIYMAEDI